MTYQDIKYIGGSSDIVCVGGARIDVIAPPAGELFSETNDSKRGCGQALSFGTLRRVDPRAQEQLTFLPSGSDLGDRKQVVLRLAVEVGNTFNGHQGSQVQSLLT